MKSGMKKGVLLWLLELAVLTGLYYLALRGRVSPGAERLAALGSGVALFLVIGAFRIAWSARQGRALLAFADTGAPFEDGQRIAAVGPILALSPPVHAPFSGEPCVLCVWNISHEVKHTRKGRTSTRRVDDFTGCLMAPFVVQTPAGNVRMLGFPWQEGFPAETHGSPEAFMRAQACLQTIPSEKTNLVKSFFEDRVADEAGYIRKDLRMAGDDFQLDPTVHTLTEEIVREGETVSAFGIYSAERQGLVPDHSRRDAGLNLVQGDSRAVGETLKTKFWKYSVGGVMLFLIAHVSLFDYVDRHQVREDPDALMAARKDALFQAVENRDLAAVTAALDAGLDPNARDETTGSTPLMMAEDPRIARRLILAGADVNVRDLSDHTPLIDAARTCNLEVVRLLLQSGADVHARDPASNRNALEWTVDCYPQGDERHEAVMKALRAAGEAP